LATCDQPLSIEDTYQRITEQLGNVFPRRAIGVRRRRSFHSLPSCAPSTGASARLPLSSSTLATPGWYFESAFAQHARKYAIEEGLIEKNRCRWAARAVYSDDFDFARKHGIKIVTSEEFHKSGVELVKRHLKKLRDRPVYVTLDIDVVDPAYAPGTGTPQVGGLSSAQILDLVRSLRGMNLVGCDLVEVSPPYDSGEITSLLAANLLFELLCVLGISNYRGLSFGKCLNEPAAPPRMTDHDHTCRKLRVVDYFTLGWGTMVGVGWLVVMDDWLLRGGPLGGVLGFAIGGALLLPIGYVYGQLVTAMPDAAGEVAYTAKVFPRSISFATGW
jgi:hypothetical protein